MSTQPQSALASLPTAPAQRPPPSTRTSPPTPTPFAPLRQRPRRRPADDATHTDMIHTSSPHPTRKKTYWSLGVRKRNTTRTFFPSAAPPSACMSDTPIRLGAVCKSSSPRQAPPPRSSPPPPSSQAQACQRGWKLILKSKMSAGCALKPLSHTTSASNPDEDVCSAPATPRADAAAGGVAGRRDSCSIRHRARAVVACFWNTPRSVGRALEICAPMCFKPPFSV